jgi:hypothetical protein
MLPGIRGTRRFYGRLNRRHGKIRFTQQGTLTMQFFEDFGDEPSVEERMPHGLDTVEICNLYIEAAKDKCECCLQLIAEETLIRTGRGEYMTMDIDPDTRICPDCYEERRLLYTPDDPMLFDGWTPLEICAALV